MITANVFSQLDSVVISVSSLPFITSNLPSLAHCRAPYLASPLPQCSSVHVARCERIGIINILQEGLYLQIIYCRNKIIQKQLLTFNLSTYSFSSQSEPFKQGIHPTEIKPSPFHLEEKAYSECTQSSSD